MKQILFFSYPYYGHIYPTIGLVKELTEHGLEVLYYATEEFRQTLEGAGAKFCNYRSFINETIDEVDAKNNGGNLSEEIGGIFGFADILLDISARYTQKFFEENNDQTVPEYIIYDSFAVWGKMIAQRMGVPAISSNPSFALSDKLIDLDMDYVIDILLKLPPDSFLQDRSNLKRLLMLLSFKLGEKYALSNFHMFNIANSNSLNIVHTSRYFQPFSEAFDESFIFIGRPLLERRNPIDFPFQELDSRPLIYITLGTTKRNDRLEFYQKCLQAFKDQDNQVVMSVGDRIDTALLGEIPNNFIVRNFVPQIEILKRASIIISHGGLGGVSEAASCGVPMVLFPQGSDQFVVSSQVERLGAGIAAGNEIGPDELREITQKVYSDQSFGVNSKLIGESLQTAGGYQKAVEAMDSFMKQYQSNNQ